MSANLDGHKVSSHDLVRVQEKVRELAPTVEEHIEELSERLGKLDAGVNERLSNLEFMMTKLLAALDNESASA